MKYLLAAVLILSAVLPVRAGHQPDHICQIATESEFYKTVASKKNAKIMLANDRARAAVIAKVNEDRKANNLFAVEVDKLAIGLFAESGMMFVGIVGFKDRCVVPGTVAVVPASDWVNFIVSLGVDADDFAEMRNG
jgi:hypothetical protein